MASSNHDESDDVVLRRIGRTLMALAALCDRAAFLPRPIRYLILWIMRPTEARVRHFLVGWAQDLGVWAGYPESYFFHNGDDRSDAIHMALRFEALAQLLQDLVSYEASLDWPSGSGDPFDHLALRFERLHAAFNDLFQQPHGVPRWAVPAPDT